VSKKKKDNIKLVGNDYLTLPNENLDSWCEKYKLTPKESQCLSCKAPIKTTIPAINKYWRGLVAPQCACGYYQNFKVFVVGLKHSDKLPEFMRV